MDSLNPVGETPEELTPAIAILDEIFPVRDDDLSEQQLNRLVSREVKPGFVQTDSSSDIARYEQERLGASEDAN